MLAPEFPPHANDGTHAGIPAGVLPRPIFAGRGVFPDLPVVPYPDEPFAGRTTGAAYPIIGESFVPTQEPRASDRSKPAAAFAPPKPRISDIFKEEGKKLLESGRLSPEQGKAVYAIIHCRTETYGYHADVCDCCGFLRVRHNSCRNRHCPTCQGIAKARWVGKRLSELLPVHCHQAVFTVPSYISRLAMFNRRAMYDLIFDAASRTLLVFGRDPKHLGAEIGFYGILHTWSQLMEPHVHVHFIVVCGGLADDGQWKEPKHGAKFLFPTRALSKVFRGKFIDGLKKLYCDDKLVVPESMEELRNPEGFEKKLDKLVSKSWRVYCKPPFSGPDEVVRYIGRYTHRIAISDGRIVSFENGRVRFKYKDSREKDPERKHKEAELSTEEFLKRYLNHVLPRGYHRIRNYGFLSNGRKRKNIETIKSLLPEPEAAAEPEAPKDSERVCPACGKGEMTTFLIVNGRGETTKCELSMLFGKYRDTS